MKKKQCHASGEAQSSVVGMEIPPDIQEYLAENQAFLRDKFLIDEAIRRYYHAHDDHERGSKTIEKIDDHFNKMRQLSEMHAENIHDIVEDRVKKINKEVRSSTSKHNQCYVLLIAFIGFLAIALFSQYRENLIQKTTIETLLKERADAHEAMIFRRYAPQPPNGLVQDWQEQKREENERSRK